ncbi:MAG: hypothetical protein GY731_08005 [Gammaproteobacteria bacterium]|nr:hypothetical protein [Gammaproteobacteria bacterium]
MGRRKDTRFPLCVQWLRDGFPLRAAGRLKKPLYTVSGLTGWKRLDARRRNARRWNVKRGHASDGKGCGSLDFAGEGPCSYTGTLVLMGIL